MTVKHAIKQLWPLLALFTALSAIYIWAIPPMEGSDEFEHFAHVVWLAEGRGFPPQGAAAYTTAVRQEASQPPLYYWLASLPVRLIGTAPALQFRPNPHFQFELDPVIPDNKNTAVHHPQDSQLGGSWRAIYAARAVSLLSGLLLIVCVYGLATAVMPDQPRAPLAAALFVGSIPQMVYHSSHVSNDILAAALCTLVLWLAARMVRQPLTVGRATAVGLVLGLATLTKVNAFILGLPLVIAWLWFWVGPYRRQRPLVLGAGLTMSATFLAVAGWWFGRNWWIYGSPFGLDTHCYQAAAFCGSFQLRWPIWVQWRDIFYSFWANFGISNLRPYPWLFVPFGLLIGLALLGMAAHVGRWWQQNRGRRQKAASPTAVILLMLASTWVASLLILEFWLQQIIATYGRLLFPALGAFVLLLLFGIWQRWPRLGQWMWLFPALLACVSPFWLIRPAYAPPTLLTAVEVGQRGAPIQWRFGEVAELLSLTPQVAAAEAGQTVPIELCWRPLAQTAVPYTLLLHLIGPEEEVLASRYTYPGLGSYPTTVWQVDGLFCDQLRLPIPADLRQSVVAHVVVGWLDEFGQRLPVYDQTDQPISYAMAGVVTLQTAVSPAAAAPENSPPLYLQAADLGQPWRAGQTNSFRLQWGVATAVAADYTLFVHLVDGETGEMKAQADGPPLAGWYPTSWWRVGEQIDDGRLFELPSDLPPGLYKLRVGWYNPANGEPLAEPIWLGDVTVVDD